MSDRLDDLGAVSTAAARWILPATATLFAALVLLASQLPLAWALRAQHKQYHPHLVLTGTPPLYLDDAAADWAFMRQAKDGRFLLSIPYTVDDHPRNYVNVLLWSLGTSARVFGADVVVVYNVAKVAFGSILLALLYALARRLFERRGEVFACFFMFVLSGGWEGPIAFLQRHAEVSWTAHSPGWWMPEISTFFSMILFPHLTAGFAAMIAAVLLMLKAWNPDGGTVRRRTAAAAGAGAVLFVVTLFHPYDAVTSLATIWTFPALIGLAERRWPRAEAFQSLVASLVVAPAVAYDVYLVSTNLAIRGWHHQGVMTTPEVGRLVMCFGVNALLAVLVLPRLRSLGRPQLAMVAWLVSGLVLIHLPVDFQRRMMGGLQLPMAALACTALAVVVPRLARVLPSRRPAGPSVEAHGIRTLGLVALLTPLNLVTPAYVHQHQWREMRGLSYPTWMGVEEFAALQALRAMAPPGAKAIASYEIGNFVPPFAGVTTYFGHNALTLDARTRRADVARFYSAGPEDDAWRRQLLDRWGIDFVLYTPRERALGGFDPSTRPWLQEVFVTGEVSDRRAAIYRRR